MKCSKSLISQRKTRLLKKFKSLEFRRTQQSLTLGVELERLAKCLQRQDFSISKELTRPRSLLSTRSSKDGTKTATPSTSAEVLTNSQINTKVDLTL